MASSASALNLSLPQPAACVRHRPTLPSLIAGPKFLAAVHLEHCESAANCLHKCKVGLHTVRRAAGAAGKTPVAAEAGLKCDADK